MASASDERTGAHRPGSGQVALPRREGEPTYLLNYRVLAEIGHGGQGIVYLAEDLRTARRVALKVLRDVGGISEEALGRLRREVEAAGRLEHPGICTVYEAVLEGATPYIAMRYVEGRTLEKRIAAAQQAKEETWLVRPESTEEPRPPSSPSAETEKLPSGPASRVDVDRVLEIIEKAARALHVAHEAKVIHRDVKPSNIMVTPEGEPVILDFGLAQIEETAHPALTRTGEIWGTPVYLSPEQLMAGAKVDRRTDIWSLGVTLYECLTLRRPFEGATNNQIFHAIQSKDPPDPCRLNRALPPDVRIVVETALEKDRDRRYETALALAEDLRAVRERRQIAARPLGQMTRLSRWAHRNPMVAASLLIAFLSLLGGLAVTIGLLLARNVALRDKEAALFGKTVALGEKESALRQSEGLRLLAESSAALARDPGLSLLLAIEGAKLAPAKVSLINGTVNEALGELREVRTLIGHVAPVDYAAFSPDGTRVVTTADDGVIRVWDVATAQTLATFVHDRAIRAEFTPKGTALVSLSTNGTCRIWETKTWKERLHPTVWNLSPDASRLLASEEDGSTVVWATESPDRIAVLARPLPKTATAGFSPDGKRILTVAADGTATIWSSDTGASVAELPQGFPEAKSQHFSPDGLRVVAFSKGVGKVWIIDAGRTVSFTESVKALDDVSFNKDGDRVITLTRDSVLVWDADTGEPHFLCGPGPGQEVQRDFPRPRATFTNDGQRIVGASCDGTAHVWAAKTGEPIETLSGQSGDVRDVKTSPDGSLVLTMSSNGTMGLWDSTKWTQLAVLRGHGGEVQHASFSADGTMLVTAANDRTARVWNTKLAFGAPLLEGHQGAVSEARFSPDGKLVLTASSDGRPIVWNAATAEQMARLRGPTNLSIPEFSPDGTRIVAISDDGAALLFESLTGTLLASLRGDAAFCQAAFGPDGARVVTASGDGSAHVWDAQDGREVVRLRGNEVGVHFAAFCGRGSRIVTASEDGVVRIWDLASSNEIAQVPGRERDPPVVSPDGGRIAVTTMQDEVGIYDATSGTELARLPGNRHRSPMFSPDGKLLTTDGVDGVFRVWNAETATELVALPHEEGARLRSFSPDSRHLLTLSKDGTAEFWDASDGRKIASIPGQGTPVTDAHFSPDGRWVVISSLDETRVFDVLTASESWVMTRRHGSVKSAQFSPDSSWLLAGYAGGVARLWPSDPLSKAKTLRPRELTLQELDAHNVDDPVARAGVMRLFADALTTDEIIGTVERRADLSDGLRKAAVTAAMLQDPEVVAEKLRRRSWEVVIRENALPEEYAMAQKWIEGALLVVPGIEGGLATLGAARYRTGNSEGALEKLEAAIVATPEGSRSYARAINAIFISMAHAKLGQHAQAATALAEAHRVLDASRLKPTEDIRRLLAEADRVVTEAAKPR